MVLHHDGALGSLLIALGKRRAELNHGRRCRGAISEAYLGANTRLSSSTRLIMSTATLAIFTYALYAIDLGDTGANVPTPTTR